MKSLFPSVALFVGLISLSADEAPAPSSIDRSQQLVVVTSSTWNAVPARLRLFEIEGDKWKQTGSWPVVVGRSGLAWGKGVHPWQNVLPQKREGDGKSPAGIFNLSSAFGSEALDKVKEIKLPYLPLDTMIECVDDAKSDHYNSIIRRDKIGKPDWNSSEKMIEYGEQYRLGVVVDHNVAPRKQGDGSCIFLHIWKGKDIGTAGCTAMEGKHMEQLVRWLDPQKNPLLVQLPEAEYERLQKTWKLPSLKH